MVVLWEKRRSGSGSRANALARNKNSSASAAARESDQFISCAGFAGGARQTVRRASQLRIFYVTITLVSTDYHDIITQEPGKRGGRPCIRGLRIAVADILGWLAAGMTHSDIMTDYPELTEDDIRAALAYASDRERLSAIAV